MSKIPITPSHPIDWTTTTFITTVDLKNAGNSYHFLYASQLYGTFFSIFGKFDFDPNTLLVRSIDLQLLNYKGVVNIGFCAMESSDIPPNPSKEDLYYGVQGGNTDTYIKADFRSPIQLTKGTPTPVTFHRVLYALNNYNRNPGGKPSDPMGVPPMEPYFDTEFHYRSGIDFFNRELRYGMNGGPKAPKILESDKALNPRCTHSTVNLLHD